MKLIALDSSGAVASVALLTEGKLLGEYSIDHKSTHSQTLLPMLDELCRRTDYDPAESAKKIFGDHYNEFEKLSADDKASEQTRAQIIANYVAANNLKITAYQDYGWDPVTLPEENIDSFYSVLD